MRSNKNNVTIAGRIHSHTLEKKTVANKESKYFGQEYIQGDIMVATDEEGLNIIPVHYSFVMPVYPSGKKNSTYTSLERILDNALTIEQDGMDRAWLIKCNTSMGVNDFISASSNEMVSAKRADGGFVTLPARLGETDKRNWFEMDVMLTRAVRVEPNDETGMEEHCRISGYAFTFRNELLPFDFICTLPEGIDYFESLELTDNSPLYTMVRGHINCSTIKVAHEETSGFGGTVVTYTTRNRRDWVVDFIKGEPYDLGDEDVMTAEEFKAALAAREVHLAEVRKRDEDYRNSKGTGAPAKAPVSAAPANRPTFSTKF